MKSLRWPLQFIITLAISTWITSTTLKTIILILFWIVSFYPFTRREFIFFIICSTVFTVSNYGALAHSTFQFTHTDLLLMPLNELFMWGFYCLNAHRFIDVNLKTNKPIQIKKLLFYAVSFTIIFSIIHDEIRLAFIAAALLINALIYFHSKRDFKYISYFLIMGLVVESLGLTFKLWFYPHAKIFEFPIWAPLMWSNIGLIMSQITIWYFYSSKNSLEKS